MLENPLEIVWYFIAVQEIDRNDFIFRISWHNTIENQFTFYNPTR